MYYGIFSQEREWKKKAEKSKKRRLFLRGNASEKQTVLSVTGWDYSPL